MAHIIERVASVQRSQQKHNIFVPPIKDDNMCNKDHVPVNIDMAGNYSWGKKYGGRQIGTGEK